MKVDGSLSGSITAAAQSAADLEAAGYSGAWTAETSHDPFLPLAVAAGSTSEIELGTSIAVAFARNPMLLANIGWDLQALTGGRFVLGPRQPDQAPHHQTILDGVEPSGGPHARDDPGGQGDLGHLAARHPAAVPGRVLQTHLDDPVLHPAGLRPRRFRAAEDLPRRCRRADDRGRRRGVRRLLLPRLHDREVPA